MSLSSVARAPLSLEPTEEQARLTKVLPGVLPYEAIRQMMREEQITAPLEIDLAQIQPASLDLRLGTRAYRVRASFLPGSDAPVMDKVTQMDGEPSIDLTRGVTLERDEVYVIELMERVALPGDVWALANPKSSTGRLDVLTRLITDKGTEFDQIRRGYNGKLYVEVAPKTFPVIVRAGSRLNQIRFLRGVSERDIPSVASTELEQRYEQGQLVGLRDHKLRPWRTAVRNSLVSVTIDLRGSEPHSVIGHKAKRHTPKIDIDSIRQYDPSDFWEPISYHKREHLILDPDEFYILATCEEVGVPPDWAAEMVPYYTRSGEYRVHYAGFFDPGFGWDHEARRAAGSKAVLEVRSHEVPFVLEHGQVVGWLRYERMSSPPLKVYGAGLKSNYQNQGLALSKHFHSWR
jgi:dCTP deaminase